jgi:hypothetical protein
MGMYDFMSSIPSLLTFLRWLLHTATLTGLQQQQCPLLLTFPSLTSHHAQPHYPGRNNSSAIRTTTATTTFQMTAATAANGYNQNHSHFTNCLRRDILPILPDAPSCDAFPICRVLAVHATHFTGHSDALPRLPGILVRHPPPSLY